MKMDTQAAAETKRETTDRDGLIMTGTLQDTTDFRLAKKTAKLQSDFEHTILHLAQNFINTPLEKLEIAIIESLQLIAEYCDADRAVIIGFDWKKGIAEHLYEWYRKPEYLFDNALRVLRQSDYEKECDQKRQDKAFIVKRLDSLPEGSEFRRQAEKFGMVSLCSYPMAFKGTTIGVITFTTVGREKDWSENDLAAIKIFCEMMTSVMLRKKEEEKLKESNEINSLILNSTSDAIAMFDYEGNKLSANDAYELSPMAYNASDARSLKDIFASGEYRELSENRLRKLRQVFETGEAVFFEDEMDGIVLWNRYYPVFKEGKVQAVTLFSTDITSKKKAEEETRRAAELQLEADILRRREKEYIEILDSFTDVTWINDFKHGWPMHSEKWLKRIGGENVPQKDMDSFLRSLIHPDDVERVDRIYETIFKNKSSRYEAEFRVKLPDGIYIWIINRAKIYYDEQGKPEKAYGTLTDITKQKETQAIILLQNKILRTINLINREALSCHTSNELTSNCLKIVKSVTKCKYSFISEIGSVGTSNLRFACSSESNNFKARDHAMKLMFNNMANYLLGCITNRDQIIHTNDPAYYFKYNPDSHPKLSAFMGIPFFLNKKLVGILAIVKEQGIFTEEDKALMKTITPTVLEVITRKRAEEAVMENELLLQTIVDSASNALVILDAECKIVMINKYYSKVFGVKPEDVIGKKFYGVLPNGPIAARAYLQKYTSVISTGKTKVNEESLMTVDGFRTFLVSNMPWRDLSGDIIGVLGMAYDITELKNAENSLRESLASLRRTKESNDILYEISHKMLSSTDPRSDISALSSKVMEYLDCDVFFNYYAGADDAGLRLTAFWGLTAEQCAKMESLPLDAAVCGRAVSECCRIIAENIQDSDDTRTELLKSIGVRAYACYPLAANGKAIGSVSFGTKSKGSFEEVELMLMKAVAECFSVALTRKMHEDMLIMQAQELRAADKNKNEFLGSLSHELRNPLATIVAGLSLMDVSRDAEQWYKAKKIVKRQVTQLRNLVEDLLDITRISRNKFVLKKEILELNRVVLSVSEDHRALFEQKCISFKTEIADESILVDADPVRIMQMIGNLLFNALSYTDGGGEVVLRLYRENNCAVISVKDSGQGIDPEFMQYLFEPFSQADKTPRRRSGGLGLGLSIVRAIAESHGGSVKVLSDGKGKGSEFISCIPVI